MLKCEHCIHKKVCIDGANYKNAEACRNFVNEKDFAPVEHGHWDVGYFHDRVCSNCLHPSNDLDDRPYHFCPHCDFSVRDIGERMKPGSDPFILIKDEGQVFIATDDSSFVILPINYCPMCGRDLRQEG